MLRSGEMPLNFKDDAIITIFEGKLKKKKNLMSAIIICLTNICILTLLRQAIYRELWFIQTWVRILAALLTSSVTSQSLLSILPSSG